MHFPVSCDIDPISVSTFTPYPLIYARVTRHTEICYCLRCADEYNKSEYILIIDSAFLDFIVCLCSVELMQYPFLLIQNIKNDHNRATEAKKSLQRVANTF